MTDTLPDGWTPVEIPMPFGPSEYQWEHATLPEFISRDWASGCRIARALSGPTIEDAKAAISKEIADERFSQYDEDFDKGLLNGLKQALNALKDLSPTPAPDLTQNLLRWDMLPQPTREALEALPNEAVQFWNGKTWGNCVNSIARYPASVYRQNPDWTPEPLTKPAVPWDVLTGEIVKGVKIEVGPNKWIVYGCTGTPEWSEKRQTWLSGNPCRMLPLSEVMDIDPGTCHARDSLVQRPKEDK